MANARILIIDDDEDFVDGIRIVMEQEGYAFEAAYTPDDGRQALARVNPDLLILDVMMQEANDGFVLAREFRQAGFKKPILMLTSLGRVSGLSYGSDEEMVPVDAFVEKPVTPPDLIAKVRELLGA